MSVGPKFNGAHPGSLAVSRVRGALVIGAWWWLFGRLATSTVSHLLPPCPVLPIHALAALLTPAPFALVLQIPIPGFWAMRENQGPSHPRNPFGRPPALRPAYPTSFSPPTPGPAPSPSPTPDPLPIPIAAPQLVPTPHHTAPTPEPPRLRTCPHLLYYSPPLRQHQARPRSADHPECSAAVPEKIAAFAPHLRTCPHARRATSTPAPSRPIPDPLPIPIPARPRNSRCPSAPHLRTDPHFLLATPHALDVGGWGGGGGGQRRQSRLEAPRAGDFGSGRPASQTAARWPPRPTSDPPGCWRWDGGNMTK
jgi:hypothetical protein